MMFITKISYRNLFLLFLNLLIFCIFLLICFFIVVDGFIYNWFEEFNFFLFDFFNVQFLILVFSLSLLWICFGIMFANDLVIATALLLLAFCLSGVFFCFFSLLYIGFIYILVYAGAISILFIFIVFLLNLDNDYIGLTNNMYVLYLILWLFFSCYYIDFFYLSYIDLCLNNNNYNWVNNYINYYHQYKTLGIGVYELGLLLYVQYSYIVVLIGFLLALCTIGPIFIVAGPFQSFRVFKNFIFSAKFISYDLVIKIIFCIYVFTALLCIGIVFFMLYIIYIVIWYLIIILFLFFNENLDIIYAIRLSPIFLSVFFVYFLLVTLSSYFSSFKVISIQNKEQSSVYECGFMPFESARTQFEVHYFLVAVLFLIFDIEIGYLYPFLVVINDVSLNSFFILIFFLIVLGFGFVFEWFSGVLFWSDDHVLDFRYNTKSYWYNF